VLGTLFVTGNSGRDSTPFIIACLIVFMFFNAGGLQLMGWLTGSEIYPLAVRGAGTSAQAVAPWSTNLLITLTLLTMINAIGVGPTMWVYAGFNVAAFLFVWRRMPSWAATAWNRSSASCAAVPSARATSSATPPPGGGSRRRAGPATDRPGRRHVTTGPVASPVQHVTPDCAARAGSGGGTRAGRPGRPGRPGANGRGRRG
jgi:hypothetical protein